MFTTNIWPILARLRDTCLQNLGDFHIDLQGDKVKCDGAIERFRFTLRSLVFQIIEVLGFPIRSNAELKILETKHIKNNFKPSFVMTTEKIIQKKSDKFRLWL